MTTRYEGMIKCPYCNNNVSFYFVEGWGEQEICEKCHKKFSIQLSFIAKKIQQKAPKKAFGVEG